MTELWKPVPGFDAQYEVSNLGRLRSRPYTSSTGRPLKGRNLALVRNANDDYLRVNVRKNGEHTMCLVHRAVALAFVPNPHDKPEVNHKDGDKHNNKADNLEWVTASENQQHALRVGLRTLNVPSQSKRVGQYDESGSLCLVYPSVAEAHRKTGISIDALYNRCGGRTQGQLLGYLWKYI